MAESGKADFLTYRLFLTGWDTSIVSRPRAGMTARGGHGVAEAGRRGRASMSTACRQKVREPCLVAIGNGCSSVVREWRWAYRWWPGSSPSLLCPGQQCGAPLRHCYGHGDGPQAQNHLWAAHVEQRVCGGGCSPPQVRAGQGVWGAGAGRHPLLPGTQRQKKGGFLRLALQVSYTGALSTFPGSQDKCASTTSLSTSIGRTAHIMH